jgi:hypothetical protein
MYALKYDGESVYVPVVFTFTLQPKHFFRGPHSPTCTSLFDELCSTLRHGYNRNLRNIEPVKAWSQKAAVRPGPRPPTQTFQLTVIIEYTPDNEAIKPRLKVLNRFYEPILLSSALAMACKTQRPHKALDPAPGATFPQESLFHDFVNKISQVCDNKKCGGKTVTAFVVLESSDNVESVEYRFASNRRNPDQLEATKQFVTRLLETLYHPNKGKPSDAAQSAALKQILLFNESRVMAYLKSLESQCQPCITSLQDSTNPESEWHSLCGFIAETSLTPASLEILLRDSIEALRRALQRVQVSLGQDGNACT